MISTSLLNLRERERERERGCKEREVRMLSPRFIREEREIDRECFCYDLREERDRKRQTDRECCCRVL